MISLELPESPLAEAILSIVRTSEPASIANHSIRSFFFAELLAAHEGVTSDAAYDRELLFAATVMHDLGVGELAKGATRFEIEGADLAAAVLREHGVPERDIDSVWEAIALHTSPGIAERRGLLAYLTRGGIGMDFGRDAQPAAASGARIHAEYPRLDMVRSLVAAIIERASQSPAAAPRYSLGGELLRERQERGLTDMELAAASCVWGE